MKITCLDSINDPYRVESGDVSQRDVDNLILLYNELSTVNHVQTSGVSCINFSSLTPLYFESDKNFSKQMVVPIKQIEYDDLMNRAYNILKNLIDLPADLLVYMGSPFGFHYYEEDVSDRFIHVDLSYNNMEGVELDKSSHVSMTIPLLISEGDGLQVYKPKKLSLKRAFAKVFSKKKDKNNYMGKSNQFSEDDFSMENIIYKLQKFYIHTGKFFHSVSPREYNSSSPRVTFQVQFIRTMTNQWIMYI